MSEQETRSKAVGRETPRESPVPVFAPPPLDHQTENQTAANVVDLSAPQRDLFQPLPSNLVMATQQTPADSHNVSLNSPDFLERASAGAENSSKSAVQFRDGGVRSSNPFDAPPQICANPFTSPSGQDGPLPSPHPVVTNPFCKAAASEAAIEQVPPIKEDLFSTSLQTAEDIFSLLSTHTPEPFPRTVTRDLLRDFSGSEEPSSHTRSSRYNPFPAVPNATPDIFKSPPEDVPSRSHPSPTLSSPPESSDVDTLPKVVLATPQGSKHSIVQVTPLIQARSFSASSEQSSPELARVRTLVGLWSLALLSLLKPRIGSSQFSNLIMFYVLNLKTSTFKRQSNPFPRRRQVRKTTPSSAEKPPRPVKPTAPEKLVGTPQRVPVSRPSYLILRWLSCFLRMKLNQLYQQRFQNLPSGRAPNQSFHARRKLPYVAPQDAFHSGSLPGRPYEGSVFLF